MLTHGCDLARRISCVLVAITLMGAVSDEAFQEHLCHQNTGNSGCEGSVEEMAPLRSAHNLHPIWPGKAPSKFRPPGSPAGTWHHTPWWVCVLHDPYERVNFWSHFIPAVALTVLGIASYQGLVIGGKPLAYFCVFSWITHFMSAVTHIWPDDHVLEKIDHLGIAGLVMGTPFTAIMAKDPDADLRPMAVCFCVFVAAAFLRPVLRTIMYIVVGAIMFVLYFQIVNLNLVAQVVMHLLGAYFFVRNGGHERGPGLSDHHFLHYWVTVGTTMHILYIRDATMHQVHMVHPHMFSQ